MAQTHGRDSLTHTWPETFSPDGLTMSQDPGSTIVPPAGSASAGDSALKELISDAARAPRIEVEAMLGQGGMGVVQLGRQVTLDRLVAVKALRPDRKSTTATTKLLHEAWVTGALEHPNVVPVHDIDFDRDGNPQIVLRRIEGMHWGQLIDNADAVREHFGASDLVDWNLGILMQVLNAIRFAHSRGIIHRDIKPENVMVGNFGEVYLVDWGLALSVRDEPHSRLPKASEAQAVAGTPVYMAPEMVDGGPFSERTDIYLAGGVLYRLLTGHPPHRGENAQQILYSVITSNPPFPEGVPAQLAAICRRAMDPDPDCRFESAEAMRLAIQDYLQHRDSTRLAKRAEASLADLEALLAKVAPDSIEDRQTLYKIFGECRFGFREALTTWSGNESARAGFERATRLMVEYELLHGDPQVAAALLAELPDPAPELVAKLEEALAAQAAHRARVARLERLSHRLDMSVGQRTRGLFTGVMGVLWCLHPFMDVWAQDADVRASHIRMILINVGFLVLSVLLGVMAAKLLVESVVNRRFFVTQMFVYVAFIALQLGLCHAGLSVEVYYQARVYAMGVILGMVVIAIDLRMLPAALGTGLAFLAISLAPRADVYVAAQLSANLGFTLNALYVWWKPKRPSPARAMTQ